MLRCNNPKIYRAIAPPPVRRPCLTDCHCARVLLSLVSCSAQLLEVMWRPTRSSGRIGELLTHVMYDHYSAPLGFDWEKGRGRGPSITDENVAERVRLVCGWCSLPRVSRMLVTR